MNTNTESNEAVKLTDGGLRPYEKISGGYVVMARNVETKELCRPSMGKRPMELGGKAAAFAAAVRLQARYGKIQGRTFHVFREVPADGEPEVKGGGDADV